MRVGRVGVGQAAKVVVAGLLLVRLLWLLWLPLLLLLLLAVVRDVLHVKVGGVLEALARCRGGGRGGPGVSVPLRPLLMGLDVLVQVVRAGEPLAALRAHVLPAVVALVGLLAQVQPTPEMSHSYTYFCIHKFINHLTVFNGY